MPRENGTIQSIDRAIQLLESLAGRGGRAALSELAQDAGLSRSTVHGLLATMKKRGFVAQDPDGNYILGLKLFELGSLAVTRLDLRAVAAPFLQGLVDEFQETVHLVLSDGLDVVYIDKRESLQSMRIVSQVGLRLPAYCTGVGKAILAFKDKAELDQLLASVTLKPWTQHTITDKAQLLACLREIRSQGYALDNEEIIEGLRCVGVPIRDYSGQVIAALSVSGPSVRMEPARVERIIPAVVAAAGEISQQLGYRESKRY